MLLASQRSNRPLQSITAQQTAVSYMGAVRPQSVIDTDTSGGRRCCMEDQELRVQAIPRRRHGRSSSRPLERAQEHSRALNASDTCLVENRKQTRVAMVPTSVTDTEHDR